MAGERVDQEGLNNVDQFYTVDRVVRHNSFTEVRVVVDVDKIREEGSNKYINWGKVEKLLE